MINYLFYKLQRPEKGWDPIPLHYAKSYAQRVYQENISEVMTDLLNFCGDLEKKSILDLGAGPGQFTDAFSSLGAEVTWHDVSYNYFKLFRMQYPHLNVQTTLGYLEEATGQYDIIFNRVCWCYCINDKQFAHHILKLLKPGGMAYLIIPNEIYQNRIQKQFFSKLLGDFKYQLNDKWGIKIGHPFLSTKRLKTIFKDLSLRFISFEIKEVETIIKLRK